MRKPFSRSANIGQRNADNAPRDKNFNAEQDTSGARKVAFTVLATGFGNLSFAEFAEGIRPVISQEFPPIQEVVLGLLNDFEIAEIRKHLPEEVLS